MRIECMVLYAAAAGTACEPHRYSLSRATTGRYRARAHPIAGAFYNVPHRVVYLLLFFLFFFYCWRLRVNRRNTPPPTLPNVFYYILQDCTG